MLGSSDTIAAATIEAVDDDITLECQFNPTELKITKKAKWTDGEDEGSGAVGARNAPVLQFDGGDAATFDLNLIFDTTRETSDSERDVRKYTNELLKLTMIRKDGSDILEPPLVKFIWGRFELFTAVVEQVDITYLLFHSNGLPARAKAVVKFKQQDDADDFVEGQNPTSRTEARKTRIVQQGDRLDLIAFQEYRHSGRWRYLAEVNNLRDPRDLKPGQILVIPPLS